MKKAFLLFVLLLVMFTVAACANTDQVTPEDTDSSDEEIFDTEKVTFMSAYAKAQDLGFEGTLEEFIELISGKDGLDGAPGKDGINGKNGTDGKDGLTPAFKIESGELKVSYDNGTTWTSLGNIKGKDGNNGENGTDGKNGLTPAFKIEAGELKVSYDNGTTWTSLGNVKGKDGNSGENGTDGKDGLTPAFKIESGELKVSYDNGTTWTSLGNVKGKDGNNGENGTDGKNGATIKEINFDDQGRLVITLTDNTVLPPVELPKKEEHIHNFGEWKKLCIDKTVSCEDSLFYRICDDCKLPELKNGNANSHEFETEFSHDETSHWFACKHCNEKEDIADHSINLGVCTVCSWSVKGIIYQLSDDETYAEIVNYTGDETSVIIPETYNNVPVKIICKQAFAEKDITDVFIPDSITSIAECAFYGCQNLVNITVSSGNSDYSSIAGHLYSKDGKNLIQYAIGKERAQVPDGVLSISDYAFAKFSSITEIFIPDSVTNVSTKAFDGCANLINIYYMGQNVEECTGLVNDDGSTALIGVRASVYGYTAEPISTPGNFWMEIPVDNGVKRLCWILSAEETAEGYANGSLRIGGDNVMINFEHAEQAPWYGARNYITSVSFTSNITHIAENVVNGYANLASISLSSSVRIVPESAFAGTKIVNDTFGYDSGLLVVDGVLLKANSVLFQNVQTVETYNGITTIAGGAFKGCTSVKRIYIASTVQYINNGAFADSDIQYVFYDGVAEGWAGISADSGIQPAIGVYYFSASNPGTDNTHWHKIGNDYAIWGCVHKFGDWIVEKASTCMLKGTQIRICIYDETHVETAELPLNDNHKLVPKKLPNGQFEITPADCLKDATITYVCENLSGSLKKCAHSEQVVIKEGEEGYEKALGHLFENYNYNNDWTCLTNGTMTAYCSRCNNATDTKDDPEHLSTGYHSFGEWIYNDSTCTTNGFWTRTCCICNKTEIIDNPDDPMTGHMVNTFYADESADCNNNATETGICYVCNDFITREIEGTKLEHEYGPYVTIPETEQNEGTIVRVCLLCGYEDIEVAEE